MRPRRRTTFHRPGRTRNLLLASPVQDSPACFCSTRARSNSGIPAVLRLAMTRPGVFSPVSHSVQAASNFSGSGGGGPADMSIGARVATSLTLQRMLQRKRPIPKDRPLRSTCDSTRAGWHKELVTSFRPCHPYRPWRQQQLRHRHHRRAYRR